MAARATRRLGLVTARAFVTAGIIAGITAAVFALVTTALTGVALAAEPAATPLAAPQISGPSATTPEISGTAPTAPEISGSASLPTPPAEVPAASVPTRYEQTDEAISYSGAWETVKKSAASGRSYARAETTGTSVNMAFTGTRLDWIAAEDPAAGVADVYLDGRFVTTVDLGALVAAKQLTVWSTGTLSNGLHTLRIVRNPSSASGTDLTVDAVDVAGTLVKCHWVEEDDPLLAYQGLWMLRTGAAFSGGGDVSTRAAGATLTVDFTGTYLAWVGGQEAMGGIAEVTLDGVQTSTIDLYGTANSHQQTLWDTGQLAPGPHTVTVEWTGRKNPLSSGTVVAADGFLVAGIATQAYLWHGCEENDPRVMYWGTWTTNPVPQASGGGEKRAGTDQSTMAVTFTGKELHWIATTGPLSGKASVSVDSGPAQVVDLSAPTTLYQQKVWSTGSLPAGTHTVQISRDESSAPGTHIAVDAFAVLGDLPSTTDPAALRIMWAQQKLTDLSYRPGEVDGELGYRMRGALIAFQKWEGLPRNGKLTDEVFSRLQTATRPMPEKQRGGDAWVEVDKTKQVLLYCENGAVVWTLPVSTGSPSVGYATPSGTYKVLRKTLETNPRWHPLYISPRGRYLAIHGYPSVPTRRASHACIRTQIWDQRDLYPLIPVGTPVYVY